MLSATPKTSTMPFPFNGLGAAPGSGLESAGTTLGMGRITLGLAGTALGLAGPISATALDKNVRDALLRPFLGGQPTLLVREWPRIC